MTMLRVILTSVVLLVASASAWPHDTVTSNSMESLIERSPSKDCNATCAPFISAKRVCKAMACRCSNEFFQNQGDCVICQLDDDPIVEASVRLSIDDQVDSCNYHGIPTHFKLRVPPEAQDIVDFIYRLSRVLRQQQTAFLVLQIVGGHVGLVIVLSLAISRRVRRDLTFINFCITWIFSSVVYSLLLYRGTDGNNFFHPIVHVSFKTCLLQGALTNGVQVMTACSTLALVVQLWIGLSAAIRGDLPVGPNQKRWMTVALLGSPYILLFCFAIPSVMVGNTRIIIDDKLRPGVLPTNFYCFIYASKPLLRAVYGVTLSLLIATTILDVIIIAIMYRHWWTVRRLQMNSGISLSIILRVVIFSIYRVIVAIDYGTVLNRPPELSRNSLGQSAFFLSGAGTRVDMLQAALPLVAFLVFATNGDIIATLSCCRRWKEPVTELRFRKESEL